MAQMQVCAEGTLDPQAVCLVFGALFSPGTLPLCGTSALTFLCCMCKSLPPISSLPGLASQVHCMSTAHQH